MPNERDCSFCRRTTYPLVDRNFRRCPECGLVFNEAWAPASYDANYFGQEYENQYGRAYSEDRESLQQRMRRRIGLVEAKPYFLFEQKRLLEIGSAAGFFLELARERGCEVQGWELSEEMANMANERGLPTRAGDFISLFGEWDAANLDQYDVVAAFYVLEHIPEQERCWQALAKLVRPQGWLVVALPSTYGPLFHFNREQWFSGHPRDHAVDYSPHALGSTAAHFGFELVNAWPEGIHPNRFPGGSLPLLRDIYEIAQKKLAFSDTLFAILQNGQHD